MYKNSIGNGEQNGGEGISNGINMPWQGVVCYRSYYIRDLFELYWIAGTHGSRLEASLVDINIISSWLVAATILGDWIRFGPVHSKHSMEIIISVLLASCYHLAKYTLDVPTWTVCWQLWKYMIFKFIELLAENENLSIVRLRFVEIRLFFFYKREKKILFFFFKRTALPEDKIITLVINSRFERTFSS